MTVMWEDYDHDVVARHGPAEICAIRWHRPDADGITSGIRHYGWVDCPDREWEAHELRQLAAALNDAADTLDRIDQQ